jgi:hypothetical protein
MPKPQCLNHLGPKPKYEAEQPRLSEELPRCKALSAVEIVHLGNFDGITIWPTLDELIKYWPSSPWKEVRELIKYWPSLRGKEAIEVISHKDNPQKEACRELLSGSDKDKKVFWAVGFSDWLKLNPKRPDMTPSKQDALVWGQKHHGLPMPRIVWIEVKRIRLDYQPVVNQQLIDAGGPPEYKGDTADLRILHFADGETLAIHQRLNKYVEAVQSEKRRDFHPGMSLTPKIKSKKNKAKVKATGEVVSAS